MKTTKSQQKLIAAQAEVKRLWNLMCEYDGIAIDSKFVVFSSTNPYATEYNNAVITLREATVNERKNAARRAKHDAYKSCGMTRVVGGLGGVYYE